MPLIVGIVLYALVWWNTSWSISPDGLQYERMAAGQTVPSPYHRRWLLPWLLRRRVWARWPLRKVWIAWGVLATVLSAAVTGWYVGGSAEQQILATLLFCGLPGIWHLNVRLPLLVDPTAYCCAVGGAALINAGHPLLGLTLIAIGASVKETTPLFAAALSLSLLPLIALSVPIWLHRVRPFLAMPSEPYLQRPVLEARRVHDFLDARTKILPWGALLLLVPFGFHWDRLGVCMLLTLALGYGQLLMAQDNARLYQWAAPAVIAVALNDPPSWVWLAVIAGLFNPYRGT